MKIHKYKITSLIFAVMACLTISFPSKAQESSVENIIVPVISTVIDNNPIKRMFYDDSKVKKWYHDGERVYTSGNMVTYHIAQDTSFSEEVEYETSCLNPQNTEYINHFNGWTFVGWREDNTASDQVLDTKIMGDDPLELYAVYRKDVKVTYYNNSTNPSYASGTRYYNNGNVIDPKFTLTQIASSGWTARGWSTSNSGNAGITYNNGATFSRDSDITLYGLYQQPVTVTYYDNSSTPSYTSGTRYWAPAGYVNPTFKLNQKAVSGWTARGWSTANRGNAAITYNNGATFTASSNIALYGLYQQTITVAYYNNSTSPSYTSGIRYWAPAGAIDPTFTLIQAASSGWVARGWSTSSSGNAGITYNNGYTFSRSSNITLYGLYQRTLSATYNGNGATGGSVATQYVTQYWGPAGYINPTITLPACGFSKTDYKFTGWNYGSVGTNVTLNSNITVSAQWQQSIVRIVQNSTLCSGVSMIVGQVDNSDRYNWSQSGPSITLGSDAGSEWDQHAYLYFNVQVPAGKKVYATIRGQNLGSYIHLWESSFFMWRLSNPSTGVHETRRDILGGSRDFTNGGNTAITVDDKSVSVSGTTDIASYIGFTMNNGYYGGSGRIMRFTVVDLYYYN